jgi:hypothetical protein
MAQGLGHPLQDLQPLIGGNTDMTDQGSQEYVTLGCHKGNFRGLNVRNPDPNFVYKWANNRPQELMAAVQQGRILVGADDQEMSAVQDLLGLEATPLDGSCMFQGMRLVKTPIERERQLQEQRQELHDARFKQGTAEKDYFDGATEEEVRLGRGKGLRMMRDDHHTTATDGPNPGNTQLDSWRPNLGLDYRG